MDNTGQVIIDSSSGIRLSYVAEGAANIVYRPVPVLATPSAEADIDFPVKIDDDDLSQTPPPTELSSVIIDPRLEGKLIRLRKSLSTTVPVTESWNHFHNAISPLFLDSQVVSQDLCRISSGIVRNCNLELNDMERDGRRSEKRKGVYLAEDEKYGTLISDMSSDERSVSIEFKPKWLVQSPNAPAGSKRCRTCALRAMKQAEARSNNLQEGHDGKGGFCPLDLLLKDRYRIGDVAEQLLGTSRYSDLDRMRIWDQLITWTMDTPLLQRLKQLQEELDPLGVLEADLSSPNFLMAMTLRDCTLFLKVSISRLARSHADYMI